MHRPVRLSLLLFVFVVAVRLAPLGQAQAAGRAEPAVEHGYRQAPQPIHDLLNAAPTPLVLVSPKADQLLVVDRLANPPISDLAQPMLRLAGLRINPATNGRHHPQRHVGLSLVDVATGKTRKVTGLPHSPYLSVPEWSPDGKQFAFTNTTADGIELWLGNAATASANQVGGVKINAVLGDPVQWMPDSQSLLVQTIPMTRGNPPADLKVPDGPIIQESDGKKAPVRTYEDLLQDRRDEDLFEYYATSQLTLLHPPHTAHLGPIHASIDFGGASVGKPAIFARVEPSPDGQHILVSRIHRPFSYILPESDFPREVEIWDRSGKLEYKLASVPLSDHVPIEGVITGPRDSEWVPTQAATLVWAEALDGGDPKTKAPFRDRLMMLSAPFKDQPQELAKLEQRFTPGFGGPGGFGGRTGIEWAENGTGLVRDYDRDRRWTRTFLVDAGHPGQTPKLIWERSIRDRYKDPGTPLMRTLANGKHVMRQQGDSIFLVGAGASPKGEFPFLDRYNLATGKSERIFESAHKQFESVIALASDDGSSFITRFESPTDPPNYFLRSAGNSADKKALTSFPDPAPQLHGVTKQLVTYKRADGVQLSFTLYLPANYKQGERLPTIVWAYPLEFNDAGTAGQVSGSPYHFTTISGISHLFLVTQGYAILDNATMPVVGDPETMNNTYVEQIVASAKAAIDKAAEMGVTDPNRVGVGGHSYGAFMTANLLAHSDLFRAGVARSGAYNRTLTPFGFQSERRTIWEAPEMYIKVSPFMQADKIKRPILLIHGMADDNSGTFPIQSERMYQAIKGNGGIVRYVQLPYEAHGYLARESTEHTLWEMVNWFDKWVKNAPAETTTKTASSGGN